MKKRMQYFFVGTIALFIITAYLSAQVRDPAVPRSWWPSLKQYIQAKSASKMLSFTHYGTPTNQVIAVFNPQKKLTIERIDVYARAKADGDSTALVLTNGLETSRVVLDSGEARQYWHDSTEAVFAAFRPCTVKFSDNGFTGTFVSGVDSPSVVIQYRIAD